MGPGSSLGEDLAVPEGARLVGRRFPDSYREGAWTALLLIDGNPLEVARDLVGQALASGLAIPSGPACWVRDGMLECDVEASGAAPDQGYIIQLRWGRDEGAHYRHVLVFGGPDRLDVGTPTDEASPADLVPQLDLPPAPEPIGEWDAPEVGEPAAVIPDWFQEEVAVVERGSRVVAPYGPAGCGTGGYSVVLSVDGDPESVVTRYLNQFEDRGYVGELKAGAFEGRRSVAALSGAAGGGDLQAIAVVGDAGDATYMLLYRCND